MTFLPKGDPIEESPARETVSDLTTSRLSVYLRCLNALAAEGQKTVSSQELARRFHLNSSQIRKDLACFGELGIRGVGYDVTRLRAYLSSTLGLDRVRGIVIAGAGNLGLALADYRGFNTEGFRMVALVDADSRKVGRRSRTGIEIIDIAHLPQLVREETIEIGVVAVPGEVAQETCDTLTAAGISAILNFAPVQLRCAAGVKLRNVDLRISLETLSFHLKQREGGVPPDTAEAIPMATQERAKS